MKTTREAPHWLYETKRKRLSIDEAWQIAETDLPRGWMIVELLCLHPIASDGAFGKYASPRWYVSAHDPMRPDGDFLEAEDDTPVRAVLCLARTAYVRRQAGQPKQYLPPPLARPAGRETPLRAHDMGEPVLPVSA